MQIRLAFFDVVLFAGMIVGFVIGIHQSIYFGVAYSYWLFMLSSLCFLWLNQRLKAKKQKAEKVESLKIKEPVSASKKKSGRKG